MLVCWELFFASLHAGATLQTKQRPTPQDQVLSESVRLRRSRSLPRTRRTNGAVVVWSCCDVG